MTRRRRVLALCLLWGALLAPPAPAAVEPVLFASGLSAPLRVTALTTGIGALPLILLGMPAVAALPGEQVQPSGWAGLLYSAIFAIVIAYIIWNSGVKKIGGARTSLYSNLIPVIGMITAALVLGEAITPLKVVGAAVIFVGLHSGRCSSRLRRT